MKPYFFTLFLLTFSGNLLANIECSGSVGGVTLSPGGDVFMGAFKNWDWQKVCNVEIKINNTTPSSCKAILSLLLTAQTTKKNVSFWFNDNQTTCEASEQARWTTLQNWYFGPKLVN